MTLSECINYIQEGANNLGLNKKAKSIHDKVDAIENVGYPKLEDVIKDMFSKYVYDVYEYLIKFMGPKYFKQYIRECKKIAERSFENEYSELYYLLFQDGDWRTAIPDKYYKNRNVLLKHTKKCIEKYFYKFEKLSSDFITWKDVDTYFLFRIYLKDPAIIYNSNEVINNKVVISFDVIYGAKGYRNTYPYDYFRITDENNLYFPDTKKPEQYSGYFESIIRMLYKICYDTAKNLINKYQYQNQFNLPYDKDELKKIYDKTINDIEKLNQKKNEIERIMKSL